jgi:hypothetical protein
MVDVAGIVVGLVAAGFIGLLFRVAWRLARRDHVQDRGKAASSSPGEAFERIGPHQWRVTKPTTMWIGRPRRPPSPEALAAMREAVADSGATAVYWFWMSFADQQPHLGLAVSPDDDALADRVGRAVEPVWQGFCPENPVFDILRLGSNPEIRSKGEVLFKANDEGQSYTEVVKEILAPDRKRKVEIYHRRDGTFGFGELSFSDEPREMCWVPARSYGCRAADQETAEREARSRVEWLKGAIHH